MSVSVEKVSVSLGTEEIAWARRKAAETDSSVSAVVSDAVRRQRQLDAMDRLLAELGTDDITEEDRAVVRAEWRG